MLELLLAKFTYRARSRHDPGLEESHQEPCKPLLWLEGAVHVPLPGWRAAVLQSQTVGTLSHRGNIHQNAFILHHFVRIKPS